MNDGEIAPLPQYSIIGLQYPNSTVGPSILHLYPSYALLLQRTVSNKRLPSSDVKKNLPSSDGEKLWPQYIVLWELPKRCGPVLIKLSRCWWFWICRPYLQWMMERLHCLVLRSLLWSLLFIYVKYFYPAFPMPEQMIKAAYNLE